MEFSIALDTELLAQQLKLSAEQARQAMDLIDSGFSIPFLAAYRREQTGGLGEEDLRQLRDSAELQRALNDRKLTMLRTIHGQGKLTEELEARIRTAASSRDLEDLYLPFKRTKRTKGNASRRDSVTSIATAVFEATEPVDIEGLLTALAATPEFEGMADVNDEFNLALREHLIYLPKVRVKARDAIRHRAVLITRHSPLDAAGESLSSDAPFQDQRDDDRRVEDSAENHPAADGELDPIDSNSELCAEDRDESGTEGRDSDMDVSLGSISEQVASHDEGLDPLGSGDGEVATATESWKPDASQGAEVSVPAFAVGSVEKSSSEPGSDEDKQSRLRAIVSIARQRRMQRREARKKRRTRLESSFKPFLHYRKHVNKIPPPEWLAIDYGERVRVLEVKVEIDADSLTQDCWSVLGFANHPHADLLRGSLAGALVAEQGTLIREVQRDAVEVAEHQRLLSQRRKLLQWIRQKPLLRGVLAIEPRLRREATVVVLDAAGGLTHHEVLMFSGNDDVQEGAGKRIAELLKEYSIDVVAVGDGPGSRDVDHVLRRLSKKEGGEAPEFCIGEVSAAATNIFAKGGRAAREFPNHPDNVRRTVALGRRLQDPMRELLKIDAVRLGRALFGEENKSTQFTTLLQDVYRSCIAEVRLDVNEADAALFRYLPGMNPAYAQCLEQHRRETGGFSSREGVLGTAGIDELALKQAIGFLHVVQSDNPLDRTAIHPDRYEAAVRLLEHSGLGTEGLRAAVQAEIENGSDVISSWRAAIGKIDVLTSAQTLSIDVAILRELLHQFRQIGRNPRDVFVEPMLRSPRVDLRQLQSGDEIVGVVVNLVDYGAFVELGPGVVGLLHVSRMSEGFVKNPREVVQEGDVVRVWVSEVDPQKGRISLTLLRQRAVSASPMPERKFDRGSRDQRGDNSSRRPQGRQDFAPPTNRERKKNRPPAPVVPLTDGMKTGNEPMRTFSDLMQFYQHQRDDDAPVPKSSGPQVTPSSAPPSQSPSEGS